MAERVLVSCRLAWDSLPGYEDLFRERAIEVDTPDFEGQAMSEEDLLPIVGRYSGIVAGDDVLSRPVIEKGERLRVISKWGVGVDAIDLEAAAARGIHVFNTPGVFAEELADYAIGFILLLARRQHEVDRRVRLGEWHKARGRSLAGKTLGIIGLGSSGSALARRAAAMKMVVRGYDIRTPEHPLPPESELVDLSTLLSSSDVISLHIPANETTRQMVDAAFLDAMKPGAWLINTSRGSLVDEEALCDALRQGRVGAAALDVFQREPLPPDHPLLSFDLVVGSHNASNTQEAVERTTEQAIQNLLIGLGHVR